MVVLSFCAFDIELYSMRRLVELLESLFKLFGGDEVRRGASTRRYQKKDAPQRRGEMRREPRLSGHPG
jgi:hypothetical protein